MTRVKISHRLTAVRNDGRRGQDFRSLADFGSLKNLDLWESVKICVRKVFDAGALRGCPKRRAAPSRFEENVIQ